MTSRQRVKRRFVANTCSKIEQFTRTAWDRGGSNPTVDHKVCGAATLDLPSDDLIDLIFASGHGGQPCDLFLGCFQSVGIPRSGLSWLAAIMNSTEFATSVVGRRLFGLRYGAVARPIEISMRDV